MSIFNFNIHYQKIRAFTLIECVMTITIVVLCCVLAIPAYENFINKVDNQIMASQLMRAISLARSEAMMHGVNVTICKSANQKTCSGEWRDGYIVKTKDQILFQFQNNIKGFLYWRGSLKREELTFLPSGLIDSEAGDFIYCDKNNTIAWAIIINLSGRARLVWPDDRDKIIDDKGKVVMCG